MALDLSPEAWAQIRYAYEHTDQPIYAICAEYGISDGTLRDRMRRWGWRLRRPPIPSEGPPPVPAPRAEAIAWPVTSVRAIDTAAATAPPPAIDAPCPSAASDATADAPPLASSPACGETSGAGGAPAAPDETAIAPRLQSAVARVLPAIETTLAKLGAGPMPPREMEQAARALSSLTRILRELNGLLGQHQASRGDANRGDPVPEDIDEFRRQLARRMDAFVEARTGKTKDGVDGAAGDTGDAHPG